MNRAEKKVLLTLLAVFLLTALLYNLWGLGYGTVD